MNAANFYISFIVLLIELNVCRSQSVPSFASKRARCAMECYTKCVMAGTPKAVYCNCPLSIELQPCNAVTAETIKRSMVTTVPHVETVYKDVRTILIKMEPYNGAFIYIFEYSTISGDTENWIFAGASSSPQIQFNVQDACRDYQFRAIVVLRSTDPALQLVVFRPRAIPVVLPKFTVPSDSIRLDTPQQSNDDQSLHVFVSWSNPKAYDDSDIYGYEQPIAYPIRCQTPEDKLTQPRIELVEGGARMHLNLPIDVLQEKCRILVEVRMLPRCVRVDSYDIQASIELDCQKFPTLKYCQKDQSPQCAEVVDVWGKEGKAMVVWQPPKQLQPLYYVLKYGLADQVGARPFISRKIINGEEMKIPGNLTNAELNSRPGIEYGLQICGIYSTARFKPPFDVIPVVPFICAECPGDALHCIDCAKIEDGPSHPFIPVVECPNNNCSNINNRPIFKSNTATLDINDNGLVTQQKHSKTLNTQAVIPIDITRRPSFENNDFLTVNGAGRVGENNDEDGLGREQVPNSNRDSSFEDITAAKVFHNNNANGGLNVTSQQQSLTPLNLLITESPIQTTTLSPQKEDNETVTGKVDFVSFQTPSTSLDETTDSRPHVSESIRLHQQGVTTVSQACKQKSGVVCEFGCVDDLRCECPKPDVPCIRGILCPRVSDLRAIYENKTKTLRLYSQTIADLLKHDSAYDKLYLEFGELVQRPNSAARAHAVPTSRTSYSFSKLPGKEHSMLSIEKMDKLNMFDKQPYEFNMNEPLNVGEKTYGLSVCALNSSLVPLILDNVLMEQSVFNDNSISALTQTLLSPVELSEEAITSAGRSETHKGFLIFLGPAFLVLGVLIFGITVLCMNLFRRRESTASKLRRRGLLRDHSRMQFTAYRPTLGVSPSTFYNDNTSRYFMNNRNVNF